MLPWPKIGEVRCSININTTESYFAVESMAITKSGEWRKGGEGNNWESLSYAWENYTRSKGRLKTQKWKMRDGRKVTVENAVLETRDENAGLENAMMSTMESHQKELIYL